MSYPLNFGIYCGMSKQFRDTFKELLPSFCKRSNDIIAGKGQLNHGRNKGGPATRGAPATKQSTNPNCPGSETQVKYGIRARTISRAQNVYLEIPKPCCSE